MLTRAVGYFSWLLFGIVLLLTAYTILRPPRRPRGVNVRMPALAMEFVRSDEDLPPVIGPSDDPATGPWREGLLRNIKFDYGFIVVYWLLFAGIAAVLARSGGRWAAWVAAAAVLCVTAAAACDVVENLRMTKVINAASLVENVATPGTLKWLFSFAAVGLLSTTFFGRGGGVGVVGVVCLLVAGLGGAGLLAIWLGSRQLWPVEVAFTSLMLVLLPLVAWAFTLKTEEFTRAGGAP
jgi:hypothetical protein